MKYITVEERELFDRLVEKYKIKGYSVPHSLACLKSPWRGEGEVKPGVQRKRYGSMVGDRTISILMDGEVVLVLYPEDLIPLSKVVQDAKFDYCGKFNCSLDKPRETRGGDME